MLLCLQPTIDLRLMFKVTVKWVEGIQTRLPMCIGGGIWGAARLKPKHRQLYLKQYLPWAIKTGKNAKFMQGMQLGSLCYFNEISNRFAQE